MRGRRGWFAVYGILGGALLFGAAAAQEPGTAVAVARPAGWTAATASGPGEFEVSGRVRLPGGRAPTQGVTLYVQDLRQVPPVITAVHSTGPDGAYRLPLGPGWWRVIPTAPGLVFEPAFRDYTLAGAGAATGGAGRAAKPGGR